MPKFAGSSLHDNCEEWQAFFYMTCAQTKMGMHQDAFCEIVGAFKLRAIFAKKNVCVFFFFETLFFYQKKKQMTNIKIYL